MQVMCGGRESGRGLDRGTDERKDEEDLRYVDVTLLLLATSSEATRAASGVVQLTEHHEH